MFVLLNLDTFETHVKAVLLISTTFTDTLRHITLEICLAIRTHSGKEPTQGLTSELFGSAEEPVAMHSNLLWHNILP